jgi:hypothetical protein
MTAADGVFIIVCVGGAGVCLLGLCMAVMDFIGADLGMHADDDGEGY